MAEAKVTSKGQITLPAEVRRRMGLRQGSRVEFLPTENGDYVLHVKTGSLRDLKGILRYRGPVVSIEEMDGAVGRAAARTDQ